MINNNVLWTFKYEPKKFEDIILNDNIKKKLYKCLKETPNILLFGSAGVGKGTFTNIFLKETGYDFMWLNASDETGIDIIRNKVKPFATGMSGDIKIVVMNEADSLTSGPQGAQKMLKELMEKVQDITRFVFMCNYEPYIMDEIKSRCVTIQIDNPPIKEIAKKCFDILNSEGIKYKGGNVISIVKKCYPDIRKTIQCIQENCIDGTLETDYISAYEKTYEKIFEAMKAEDYNEIRVLLRSNFIDYVQLFNYLYERAGDFGSPGDAIIEIGDHLVNDNVIAIKEINFMHMVFNMTRRKVI